MKKGLSALLIAAALFGFYGGAVNLNDVLACKDYWEAEDERTTADLNKLEDGLNQLKENEQAYLDGLDTLAEGEQALADGEAQYAAGQAELAKGEADYAAAPGKLADARKQISAGEQTLKEGEQTLANGYAARAEGKQKLDDGETAKSGLDQLIAGLTKAKNGFENEWKPGFEKVDQTGQDMGLRQGRQVIVQQFSDPDNQKSLGLVEQMTGKTGLADNINNDATYESFDAGLTDIVAAFGAARTQLDGFANLASSYAGNEGDGALLAQAAAGLGSESAASKSLEDMSGQIEALQGLIAAQEAILDDETATEEEKAVAQAKIDGYKEGITNLKTLIGTREKVVTKLKAVDTDEFKQKLALVKGLENGEALYQAIRGNLDKLEANSDSVTATNGDFAKSITSLKTYLGVLAEGLTKQVEAIDAKAPLLNKWHTGYGLLAAGKDEIDDPSKGVPYAFATMLSNDTIREVLNEKAPSLIPALQMYRGNKLDADDLDDFDDDMTMLCNNVIPNALAVLRGIRAEAQKSLDKGYSDLAAADKKLAAGEKELAAGRAKLAAGKKEYAKGLADYKAAPGKLAAGRAKLADAEQQLADGRKQLADGKEKLAEYEDGEQQVRDGLATLMASEANGGLQSILDRRSGDEDFDNGDEHLELDEGLDAVTVGREYKADSGELVTAEIMKRAIGTGLGLAAGALAVLAGLLSLLKKNKGAGVCAALTAIAGGAGIATGTSAGLEFSSIAGSAVGATPWIAFGVLAAVAAVHAIAHFAAKPEA